MLQSHRSGPPIALPRIEENVKCERFSCPHTAIRSRASAREPPGAEAAPGANEVLVAIEYSPINPNDLLVAQGVYPLRPALPSVIGNEGVGRVLAVGPGVTNVAVGDRVVPPRSSWVWRERMVIPAGGLLRCPGERTRSSSRMLGDQSTDQRRSC